MPRAEKDNRERRAPHKHHRLVDIMRGYGLWWARCSCGWRDPVGQQDGYEAGLAHEMHCDEVFG